MSKKPTIVKGKAYKRNFLKSVILRFDFPNNNLNSLKKFHDKIKEQFPFQSQEKIANVIMLDPTKSVPKNIVNTVWTFLNPKKTKRLQIASDHILIEYFSYTDKNELLDDVKILLIEFLTLAQIDTINRIGLRYINDINLNDIKNSFTWDKYIASKLVGHLDFIKEDNEAKLARAVSKLIVKKQNADISFTYGLFNVDFPNELVRKEYTLDYDCYTRFPVDPKAQDVVGIVKEFNGLIETLFESSITKELRAILNKKP